MRLHSPSSGLGAVLAGAMLLGAAPASAQGPTFPGLIRLDALVYEAVTAQAPRGVSRLILTPIEGGAVALDLRIVAPNPTQHKGHIQGLATREGMRYTLKAANFIEDGSLDDPKPCTLLIEADANRARVVSAEHCSGFHGAAASFMEQGQDLVRVP
ncbi:hypothetical protein [Massilia sp. IC2-476]|uniref:hypothetical protein n=1 Tax=Massilia sp. IC2-476 TaxID=2887199 RepID=UPI001D0F8EB0|nr:hypothetical protein [Massilia sp. IC2-476]MCC2974823.1 hypothetical protein [Massilia sp. IC2-476]